MIKRKIILLTACCALLFGCGWLVFQPGTSESAAPPPASANGEALGSFVELRDGGKTLVLRADGADTSYTVASSVWVYRDNRKAKPDALQPGDDVQVIFNGSKEVAYIKANTPQTQTPSAEPSPSPTVQVTPTPAPPQPSVAPTAEPQPTASVQPQASAQPQVTAKPVQREDRKQMYKVKKQKHNEDDDDDGDHHDGEHHDGEHDDGGHDDGHDD